MLTVLHLTGDKHISCQIGLLLKDKVQVMQLFWEKSLLFRQIDPGIESSRVNYQSS